MSGGRYQYYDISLKSEIEGDDFEDVEIQELVNDVLDLIHEYDWYMECDTSREDYLKAKNEFKHKWFGDPDRRLKKMFRTIQDSLDKCKAEIVEGYFEVTDD